MRAFGSTAVRKQLALAVDRRAEVRAKVAAIRRKPVADRDRSLGNLETVVTRLDSRIGDLTRTVDARRRAEHLEAMRLGWEFPSGPQTYRGSPEFREPVLREGREASWALTLVLGVTPERQFDPDTGLKPHLHKLFKDMASEVFGVHRRQVKHLTTATAPLFLGVYESHDEHGRPWPHIHGAIALGGHPEALLRGFLRDRWGYDANADRPAIVARDEAPVPMASVHSGELAPRSVIRRPGYRSSFCLRPIYSDYWFGEYLVKRGDSRDVSVWTSADIMNLKA